MTICKRGKAETGNNRNLSLLKKNNLCQFLEWDSHFFECSIARVLVNKLNPDTIKSVMSWCNSNKIDCLYFLADADDDKTIYLAEKNGFHLVDIRLTFGMRLENTSIEPPKIYSGNIRPSNFEDIPFLCDIAGTSYHDTRFYYDTHFPIHQVDSLYKTWIEKSCNGYADVVIVAEIGENIAGYISCHQDNDYRGRIGLIGVHPDWLGRGIGKALMNSSLDWFDAHGINKVEVVTQGRNLPAQRLYEKCGFRLENLQLWYHRWFNQTKG